MTRLSREEERMIRRWTQPGRAAETGHRINLAICLILTMGLMGFAVMFAARMVEAADDRGMRGDDLIYAFRVEGRGLSEREWGVVSLMGRACIAFALGLVTLSAASAQYRLLKQGRAFRRAWQLRQQTVPGPPPLPPAVAPPAPSPYNEP